MLVIRRAQMEVFGAEMERLFEDRMIEHVFENYPGFYARVGEAGTRERVRAAVAKGKSYGIDMEDDLAALLGMTIELGPDFERDAERVWTLPILESSRLSGSGKMVAILSRLGGLRKTES